MMTYIQVIKEINKRIKQKEKEILEIKQRRREEIIELARQADNEIMMHRKKRYKVS